MASQPTIYLRRVVLIILVILLKNRIKVEGCLETIRPTRPFPLHFLCSKIQTWVYLFRARPTLSNTMDLVRPRRFGLRTHALKVRCSTSWATGAYWPIKVGHVFYLSKKDIAAHHRHIARIRDIHCRHTFVKYKEGICNTLFQLNRWYSAARRFHRRQANLGIRHNCCLGMVN